jgi:hypothetical protein
MSRFIVTEVQECYWCSYSIITRGQPGVWCAMAEKLVYTLPGTNSMPKDWPIPDWCPLPTEVKA